MHIIEKTVRLDREKDKYAKSSESSNEGGPA